MFAAACASLAFGSTGCATIINGTKEEVRVASQPEGAEISIVNYDDVELYAGKTPHTFRLDKSEKNYKVRLKLAGYRETEVRIHNDFSGWVLCNLACGEIGFAVDIVDGAIWNLHPNEISVTLQQGGPAPAPRDAPPPVAPPGGVEVIPGPQARDVREGGDPSRVYAVFLAKDAEGHMRYLAVPLIRETVVLASR